MPHEWTAACERPPGNRACRSPPKHLPILQHPYRFIEHLIEIVENSLRFRRQHETSVQSVIGDQLQGGVGAAQNMVVKLNDRKNRGEHVVLVLSEPIDAG